MVSTQDSESCDPSSNLGGTCSISFVHEKRCKRENIKDEAPARFELAISCLLDRRFNQLSHGAEVLAVSVICLVVKTCKSFNHFLIHYTKSLVQPVSLG